jgi:hypothetical protein
MSIVQFEPLLCPLIQQWHSVDQNTDYLHFVLDMLIRVLRPECRDKIFLNFRRSPGVLNYVLHESVLFRE